MHVTETMILYLMLGTAIGTALWVARSSSAATRSVPELMAWILFWPVFAPAVLGAAFAERHAGDSVRTSPSTDTRLHDAQQRLVRALHSLDGLGEQAAQPHFAQIDTMMQSLDHAQERLMEMESLSRSPEFDLAEVDRALHDLRARGYDDNEARVRSLQARRRNIERLRGMRDHTRDELERALLRLDEMSSQILLLRFADHPETKLAALLREVAGNVEDLARAVGEMNELG